MSSLMHPSQLQRRTSRSSGSQPAGRPSRVEKPRSHQNSPRTMERRKTTTETKLYATLDDHFKMMFGVAPEEVIEERPQPSRPMSWHPSSTRFQAPQSTSYFDWSQQYSASPRNSVHDSEHHLHSTRNSMFETTPAYPNAYGMHRDSDESDYSWQSVSQQTPGDVYSVLNTPTTEPLPWYLQQWAQKIQAQAHMDSQNGSTDFLPIQHPTGQDEEMEDDDGEKLVALGLYDTPEPSLFWGGLGEATGKGLKLEETWQPPEDEEGEDEADDASSEASVEEPSPPLPLANQQAQQLQMPVRVKTQTPGSMEGQSFFFDDDEAVSKEWWFHQLKQPAMPVRETGLGYGWL
ncbi:uncharacterized protein K460DRAFT_277728 [Cucurbitaria berberidis CBS 394.84]|uniref:Uncharacterized protein n=1 Tax=Cucurbitaria berberidis CBS 394.84 TaxID=1168544 RepID=A0A9P4GJV9_9PLEO|nr:uncharacterized protein K460DRAFT_277728 [Cucurbitaria berberidis CBS 394.84]KAF1846915.1 hypothetical protein K460DRAFT_277728 [Cucurbitaria berberidis CBS 394.84]